MQLSDEVSNRRWCSGRWSGGHNPPEGPSLKFRISLPPPKPKAITATVRVLYRPSAKRLSIAWPMWKVYKPWALHTCSFPMAIRVVRMYRILFPTRHRILCYRLLPSLFWCCINYLMENCFRDFWRERTGQLVAYFSSSKSQKYLALMSFTYTHTVA